MKNSNFNRRDFLKLSLTTSGALLISFNLQADDKAKSGTSSTSPFMPNAWIRIDRDNSITFIIDRSELGQGISTGLSMLLAEELHVELNQIRFEFAPSYPVYKNRLGRVQSTGNSTGIRAAWTHLREVAAVARETFITAAAQHWQLARNEIQASNGIVVHVPSQMQITYGELLPIAAEIKPETNVALKSNAEFRVIGHDTPRLDAEAKLTGKAQFGIDIDIPGLLIATTKHAPWLNATLKHFDASAGEKLPGVRAIVAINETIYAIAESFWQARQALNLVDAQWQKPSTILHSRELTMHWQSLTQHSGAIAHKRGDVTELDKDEVAPITLHFQLPFQAHATMEPMNCTVDLREDRCDIWVPTQNQSSTHEVAVELTGLDYSQVHVHTTYIGGGFGRRGEVDFVREAILLAQKIKQPIKLIWSRERDIQNDYYRPASVHAIYAVLNNDGYPRSILHRIACPPIIDRIVRELGPAGLPRWMPYGLKRWSSQMAAKAVAKIDGAATGGATDLPYAIPNHQVEYIRVEPNIRVGFWRSVGHSHNAFVIESMIDEFAHQAKIDPVNYRRNLLLNRPRHLRVLEHAAELSNFMTPLPPNTGRGIAIHESFGSVVAQVAQVNVTCDGDLTIERIHCVIDCGTAVHPELVKTQLEGGIAFGLSATLKSEITISHNRIDQSNFHDFPIIRFNEMPPIIVEIIPSNEPPGGVGETGVPCVAPAIANAIFAATGKRIRKLPIRRTDFIDAKSLR